MYYLTKRTSNVTISTRSVSHANLLTGGIPAAILQNFIKYKSQQRVTAHEVKSTFISPLVPTSGWMRFSFMSSNYHELGLRFKSRRRSESSASVSSSALHPLWSQSLRARDEAVTSRNLLLQQQSRSRGETLSPIEAPSVPNTNAPKTIPSNIRTIWHVWNAR